MVTSKTESAETAVVAQPTPFQTPTTAQFTKDPDQENWIALENERIAKQQEAQPSGFQRAAEASIMFFNSPQNNDQWIGVGPLKQEDYPGVDLGSIRKVPLNTSEVLQAGRKVKLPSGDTMILPAGITSPEQIVHPETGERLLSDEKKSKK